MTFNEQREWHENGHAAAAIGRKLPVTAQQGPSHPSHHVLESLCRTVTDLARATATTPTRIRLQQGETTVEVEWPDPAAPCPGGAPPAAGPADPAPAPEAEADTLAYICAPTVGTFYHAAAPEAPPFVSVGDLVRPGQPVGVLEVMKMMSTIEADTAGRVVEILVPNGQSVEFEQRLIAVEPAAGEPGTA